MVIPLSCHPVILSFATVSPAAEPNAAERLAGQNHDKDSQIDQSDAEAKEVRQNPEDETDRVERHEDGKQAPPELAAPRAASCSEKFSGVVTRKVRESGAVSAR